MTAGWVLGANWPRVEGWVAPIAPLIYLTLIVLAAAFFWRRYATRHG